MPYHLLAFLVCFAIHFSSAQWGVVAGALMLLFSLLPFAAATCLPFHPFVLWVVISSAQCGVVAGTALAIERFCVSHPPPHEMHFLSFLTISFRCICTHSTLVLNTHPVWFQLPPIFLLFSFFCLAYHSFFLLFYNSIQLQSTTLFHISYKLLACYIDCLVCWC